jgi:hypothetical protein
MQAPDARKFGSEQEFDESGRLARVSACRAFPVRSASSGFSLLAAAQRGNSDVAPALRITSPHAVMVYSHRRLGAPHALWTGPLSVALVVTQHAKHARKMGLPLVKAGSVFAAADSPRVAGAGSSAATAAPARGAPVMLALAPAWDWPRLRSSILDAVSSPHSKRGYALAQVLGFHARLIAVGRGVRQRGGKREVS